MRDWRAWAFVATVLVISLADALLPAAVNLQIFLAVPIVASAVLGRTGLTLAVTGVALLSAAGTSAWSGSTLGDSLRRMVAIALVGVATAALTRAVRRADVAQARQRRLYRLLAENASDVVYASGPDRLVTWVSPNVEAALGWRPDELIGTVMADLAHPDDRPLIDAARAEAFAGGSDGALSWAHLGRMRGRDGAYRWVAARMRVRREGRDTPAGVVGGITVVDDLVAAREEARAQEARLQATLRSLLDPHVLLRAERDAADAVFDLVFADANDAACADMDRARADIVGTRLTQALSEGSARALIFRCATALDSDAPLILDNYPIDDGRRRRHVDIRGVRIEDSLSLTWRDVTDRHEASRRVAESEERYRLLAENSSDVVFLTRDRAVEWVSPSLTHALGWRPEDWLGRPFEAHAHPDDLDRLGMRREEVAAGSTRVIALRVQDRDGAFHWIELHAGPFLDAEGRIDGVVGSFRVTDDEVAAQEDLERRARLDDLTGALTRQEILRRLGELRRSSDRPAAILFCDLDRFKGVNDTYGHAVGDRVLVETVRRIRAIIRGEDLVARIGGDEFLVVLPGLADADRARKVAEEIRQRVSEPTTIEGGEASATLSIGVGILSANDDANVLIARADAAMYSAKRAGRNQVVMVEGPSATLA